MTTLSMKRKLTRRLAALLGGAAVVLLTLALKAQTNTTTVITVNGPGVTNRMSFNPSDFYRLGGGDDDSPFSLFYDPLATDVQTTAAGTQTFQGADLIVSDNFDFTGAGLDTFSISYGPGFNEGFGVFYQGLITNTSIASGNLLEIQGFKSAVSDPGPYIDYGYDINANGGTEVQMTSYNISPFLGISRTGTNITLAWTTNFAGECNLAKTSALFGTNTAWAVVTNTRTVSNGLCQTTLPLTSNSAFFRLQPTNYQSQANLTRSAGDTPSAVSISEQ